MLPRGAAKKVIIYLNQDTRAHAEPLWSTVLSFLRHKNVAGATLFRADAGFGAHHQFHDPHSEYIAEHSPVRIEFVETPERTDELLPSLYEMVTDGLVTVQDVSVIKSANREARARPAASATPGGVQAAPAKLVRIYLGEADRWNDEPLHEAIVKRLLMMNFAGATVYRGIAGYGAKGHLRKGGRLHISHDLPIMISVVEQPDRAAELVETVAGMMQDGIIVTSDVELRTFVRGASSSQTEHS